MVNTSSQTQPQGALFGLVDGVVMLCMGVSKSLGWQPVPRRQQRAEQSTRLEKKNDLFWYGRAG